MNLEKILDKKNHSIIILLEIFCSGIFDVNIFIFRWEIFKGTTEHEYAMKSLIQIDMYLLYLYVLHRMFMNCV